MWEVGTWLRTNRIWQGTLVGYSCLLAQTGRQHQQILSCADRESPCHIQRESPGHGTVQHTQWQSTLTITLSSAE
jgi:hypothetical protein